MDQLPSSVIRCQRNFKKPDGHGTALTEYVSLLRTDGWEDGWMDDGMDDGLIGNVRGVLA